MRIALELQPCCGKRSGIGTYAYELACRLKDQEGLEFSGNLFNFCGRNDVSVSLSGINMPIQENRLFPYGIYRRFWHIAPISYQSLFIEKADLHVFFNYIVPPHIDGRVITTVHDMTYLRFPETMDARNYRRIINDIQHSVERSAQIMTISQFSKQEIVELLQISPERVSVVYAAPSSLTMEADFAQTAEKYGLKRPYLLYIGTIEPRKNLTRLIEAFDYLKQKERLPHQLILAGGNGWNNEEIYRTASRVACREDIIFTGYISGAEKTALYQNADAFVFPSLYEGFGIPPLEAMSQGCPVVCSNAASLPEVVGNAAVLVDPLGVESISNGILKVLSDTAFRNSLIELGIRRYQKFSWQKSADQFTAVCKEALGLS